MNLGIASALNKGIQYAINNNYEYIITLDHDSILDLNTINLLINTFYEFDGKLAIVGPDIINSYTNTSKYRNFSFENNLYNVRTNIIQSGCVYKTEIFNKLGLFNEKLFIYYVDDEFCRRALKEGYKILINRDAKLYHKEGLNGEAYFIGKKISYRKYSEVALYYISRNTIYMVKNYDFKCIRRIFIELKNLNR